MNEPTETPPPQPTLRVLIVDDNAEWAMVLTRLLERRLPTSAREIRWESSLKTAQDSLAVFKADVTLLDLTLPDSSAEETIEAIRMFLPPVFVISGFDDGDDTLLYRCIEAGAKNFYTKDAVSLQSLTKDIVVQYAVRRFRQTVNGNHERDERRTRV